MYRAIFREIEAGGKIDAYKYKLHNEDTKTYEIINKTFEQAKQTGDIYKISYYGNTKFEEFFAESFVIYETGTEELPDYINNMFEEVLKI